MVLAREHNRVRALCVLPFVEEMHRVTVPSQIFGRYLSPPFRTAGIGGADEKYSHCDVRSCVSGVGASGKILCMMKSVAYGVRGWMNPARACVFCMKF